MLSRKITLHKLEEQSSTSERHMLYDNILNTVHKLEEDDTYEEEFVELEVGFELELHLMHAVEPLDEYGAQLVRVGQRHAPGRREPVRVVARVLRLRLARRRRRRVAPRTRLPVARAGRQVAVRELVSEREPLALHEHFEALCSTAAVNLKRHRVSDSLLLRCVHLLY